MANVSLDGEHLEPGRRIARPRIMMVYEARELPFREKMMASFGNCETRIVRSDIFSPKRKTPA